MAALTGPRNIDRMGSDYSEGERPVGANAVLYNGALCVTNAAGYLVPASTATGLRRPCVHVTIDNARSLTGTAANGGVTAKVQFGIFKFKNSASADEIVQADVGSDCFIVDDQTVAKTNGSSTRSTAGEVVAVDATGVFVALRSPV